MRFFRLVVMTSLALVLGGCVETAPPAQASKDAFFRSFVGQTVGQFVQRTGVTPSDYFDTADGRTFKVITTGPTVFVPPGYGFPAYAATPTCSLLLNTRQIDKKGTADSWRIKSILARGQC